MNSHSTSAFSHPTRCRLSSAPVAQSVRAPNVRCQCASSSNGRADNDKAWMDVHMPALRDRLDDMRQRESTDGANGISDGSVPTGRRSTNPAVWTIRSKPVAGSSKPHSFRDEYWLRGNKSANSSGLSPDGSFSLHEQFHEYVQANADRLDIAGRPPMPNSIDLALAMDRRWEEMSQEIEKWHKKKWERLSEDEEEL